MTEGLLMLVGVFIVVSVGAFIETGTVLIPGALLIIVGAAMVRPRRGIALMSTGLLVMHESMADATPNRILFQAPLSALAAEIHETAGTVQTNVFLELGPERVRIKRSTYESLLVAATNLRPAGGYPGTAGPSQLPDASWLPDPSGRYQYRYWNGSVWTTQVSVDGSVFVDAVS